MMSGMPKTIENSELLRVAVTKNNIQSTSGYMTATHGVMIAASITAAMISVRLK